jgi:hypothetical protein
MNDAIKSKQQRISVHPLSSIGPDESLESIGFACFSDEIS